MHRLGTLTLFLLAAGCAAPANRPVAELSMLASLPADLVRAPRVRLVSYRGPDSPADSGTEGESRRAAAGHWLTQVEPPHEARFEAVVAASSGRSLDPTGFDSSGGLIDLGLPVVLDLGAGEAPFDDGGWAREVGQAGRPGFSDTVLTLTVRRPLGVLLQLHGTAALVREQDLTILDGLSTARFAFAVVGIGASF